MLACCGGNYVRDVNLGSGPIAPPPVDRITVEGNKVLFGGQPKSMAGVSLFWSNDGWGGEKFYNPGAIDWLKQSWGVPLVRCSMGTGPEGGGYLTHPITNVAKVQTVMNSAINSGMYVIIDWHSHHAEKQQQEAIHFFSQISAMYNKYNNVIYEIYNEPESVSWAQTIKPYAEAVIAAIRANDPHNLIVVGTPNWSQDVDEAALSPITAYSNIAYALHFYAATHKQTHRDKAQLALQRGLPLFVTEWGPVSCTGAGAPDLESTQAWLKFLRDNHISHVQWALNDKEEGASLLQHGVHEEGGWNNGALTESGRLAKSIFKGRAFTEGS
jgi:endoglucanase